MKREIKYRVWNPRYKEFSYWGFIGDGQFKGIPTGGGLNLDECKIYSQQFTGLLDKSGEEIYEGDIVRYDQSTKFGESINRYTTEVKYEDYGFTPMIYHKPCEDEFYSCEISDIEVISNIYENPELINPTKHEKGSN